MSDSPAQSNKAILEENARLRAELHYAQELLRQVYNLIPADQAAKCEEEEPDESLPIVSE